MKNEEDYYAAVSLMMQGLQPADIADRLQVSRSTVVSWYSKFKAHKEAGTIDQMVNLSELAIREAVTTLQMTEVDAIVAEAKAKVDGLTVLSTTIQSSATFMVNRITSLAASANGTDEIVALTEALCKLQNAFFNQNRTQVNVQNNFTTNDARPYGAFLGDQPGA